jgi:hypothetical protein
MTWTKLSDDFSDHCWELSDAAYRLHVDGLIWSNRKLLDCVLDKDPDEMRRWTKRPEAAAELVKLGFWTDEGAQCRIRHHALYQRTREEVIAQQERSKKNGQKGGRPPGPPREKPPRKRGNETQSLTQMETQVETQVGYGDNENGAQETQSLTQLPTQMDGTGQDSSLNVSTYSRKGKDQKKPGEEHVSLEKKQGKVTDFDRAEREAAIQRKINRMYDQ